MPIEFLPKQYHIKWFIPLPERDFPSRAYEIWDSYYSKEMAYKEIINLRIFFPKDVFEIFFEGKIIT